MSNELLRKAERALAHVIAALDDAAGRQGVQIANYGDACTVLAELQSVVGKPHYEEQPDGTVIAVDPADITRGGQVMTIRELPPLPAPAITLAEYLLFNPSQMTDYATAALIEIEQEVLGTLPNDGRYLDPPDGRYVTMVEQLHRMRKDADAWHAAKNGGESAVTPSDIREALRLEGFTLCKTSQGYRLMKSCHIDVQAMRGNL